MGNQIKHQQTNQMRILNIFAAALAGTTTAVTLEAQAQGWDLFPSLNIPLVDNILNEVEKVAEHSFNEAESAINSISGGATTEALAAAEVFVFDGLSALSAEASKAIEELQKLDGVDDIHEALVEAGETIEQIVTEVEGTGDAGKLAFAIVETIYGIPHGTLDKAVGVTGDLCEQLSTGELDLLALAEPEKDWEEELWGVKRYLNGKYKKNKWSQGWKAYRNARRQVNKRLGLDEDDYKTNSRDD